MKDSEFLTRDYDVEPDTLWMMVKRALTTIDGVTLEQADDAKKTALFKTGITWTSWGQNMIATIEPLGQQSARLHTMGQIRHTILSSNWGEELHQKAFVRNLTDAVDHALIKN